MTEKREFDNRNTYMDNGNYFEKVEKDYVQGDKTVNIYPLKKSSLPDTKIRLLEQFSNNLEGLKKLTGRTGELKRISELIIKKKDLKVSKSKNVNVVLIYGTPGVGKSALACRFAFDYQESFPGGVYALKVDKDRDDIRAIASQFAKLCGQKIDLEDQRNARVIMQDVFAERQALLILDNVEKSEVQGLFSHDTKYSVIITTRNSNLPDLFNISQKRKIKLDVLREKDSLKLLEQLVGERIRKELIYSKKIAKRVGNLPLALQVVGTTLKKKMWQSLSLKDYTNALENVKEKLQLLEFSNSSDLDVFASFDLSLDQLSEEVQTFFNSLGACADSGFSLSIAKAVGNCSHIKAISCLDALYEHSLVDINKAKLGEDRYNLHTLIHDFAKYRLEQNASLLTEVKNRHANYFLNLICDQDTDLDDGKILAYLDQNIEGIIIAAEWLAEQEIVNADFILRLGDFFEQYNYYQQAKRLIDKFSEVVQLQENRVIASNE